MKRKALVIGAGVGGLATAGMLARSGWKVTVLEKNREGGGRCGRLWQQGFRFDLGATLFLMRDVFEEVFARLGSELGKRLELTRVDPHSRLYFSDGRSLLFTGDLMHLCAQCEAFEPGSTPAVLRFLGQGWFLYRESMRHLIRRDFAARSDLISAKLWQQFLRPSTWRNRWGHAGSFFKSEALRIAFTCQDLYIGMSPFRAPAIYAIMPAMELLGGLWYPKGGMWQIARVLEALAREHGVAFAYGTPVRRILHDGRRACGVETAKGERLDADLVVANADLMHVYRDLLPDLARPLAVKRMVTSCSSQAFYWGLRRPVHRITHGHSVLIGEDWKGGLTALEGRGIMPVSPHFYLNAPTRHDPAAAAKGKDALMAIVPCPALPGRSSKEEVRRAVLRRLSALEGRNLEKDLVFEAGLTPEAWREKFNLEGGAMLGALDHRLAQMGPLRPSNRHGRLGNLYFVGGSTRPASGVPMVLLSALLTVGRVEKEQAL